MLRLDFLKKRYSIEEVVDAYTEGNIDNFKGDKEFLFFLISYSLGAHLKGSNAKKFQDYAKYDGIANIMRLDEYGYFGEKMYKIYEICEKDKIKFIRACDLIGEYSIKHILEKKSIDTNLKLKEPVDFFDDTIVLSTGKKPKYDPEAIFLFRFGNLDIEEEFEYYYELERSFRKRINESIKRNNDDIPLLKEMPPYLEKIRLEREEREKSLVKDDYLVDINNIYFGTEMIDFSGGIFGVNMRMVSFFERTNVTILNYQVFKRIPEGDCILLDGDGKVCDKEVFLKNRNVEIELNNTVRSVEIASVPTIFTKVIEKLEEEPIKNEVDILEYKCLLDFFEDKKLFSVGELHSYEGIIRDAYELAFGTLFTDDDNKKFDIGDNPRSK